MNRQFLKQFQDDTLSISICFEVIQNNTTCCTTVKNYFFEKQNRYKMSLLPARKRDYGQNVTSRMRDRVKEPHNRSTRAKWFFYVFFSNKNVEFLFSMSSGQKINKKTLKTGSLTVFTTTFLVSSNFSIEPKRLQFISCWC